MFETLIVIVMILVFAVGVLFRKVNKLNSEIRSLADECKWLNERVLDIVNMNGRIIDNMGTIIRILSGMKEGGE